MECKVGWCKVKVEKGDWTIFFSAIFFLSGMLLIISGSFAANLIEDHLAYFDTWFDVITVLTILFGILVVLISYFGIVVSIREYPTGLKTFYGMVVVLFFIEVALGSGTFVYHAYRARRGTAFEIDDAFNEIGSVNDKEAREFMDWAQQKMTCCGIDGFSSYEQRK